MQLALECISAAWNASHCLIPGALGPALAFLLHKCNLCLQLRHFYSLSLSLKVDGSSADSSSLMCVTFQTNGCGPQPQALLRETVSYTEHLVRLFGGQGGVGCTMLFWVSGIPIPGRSETHPKSLSGSLCLSQGS